MYEAKTSVSKLSKHIEYKQSLPLPQFIDEKLTISKAQIGTLTHLVMQKLDFSKDYTLEEIEKLLLDLVNRNIITDKEKQVINKNSGCVPLFFVIFFICKSQSNCSLLLKTFSFFSKSFQ